MPNQRSKNKVHLGGFVEKEFHHEISQLAKQKGMESNRFGFAVILMKEAIASREKRALRRRS